MTTTPAELTALAQERDLRFYDAMDVYSTFKTAGEVTRLAQREPLLDHEGAAVLEAAMVAYAIPAMDPQERAHLRYCLKLCPRKGVRA